MEEKNSCCERYYWQLWNKCLLWKLWPGAIYQWGMLGILYGWYSTLLSFDVKEKDIGKKDQNIQGTWHTLKDLLKQLAGW